MKRNLSRSGNGWSLFIPKAIIELLDIQPTEDQVELEVENKVLKVKRATKEE